MVLRTVAVTGVSGMVGRHLAVALTKAGFEVRASSRTRPSALPPSATWAAWDLCDWKSADALDRLFEGADAVVHAGAAVPGRRPEPTRRQMLDANVRATLCLAEWAAQRKLPLVFISGAVVYADVGRPGIKETDAVAGGAFGGFYGLTKALAESMLEPLSADGLRLSVLRPSSIYGDGLPGGKMIAGFLAAARRGETIEVAPPAGDRINVVHAADVARAAVLALSSGAAGVFNVRGPETVSVEDIARACVGAVGAGCVAVADQPAGCATTLRFDLDGAAAAERLGYRPSIDLKRGLAMMLNAAATPA